MMRLFQEGSTGLIKKKLIESFESLDRVNSDEDFNRMHEGFCNWFIENIHLAKRKKPPLPKSIKPPSYGHAAKILDVVLKVYVYYCRMPSIEKAETLIPWLNSAIDGAILRHLVRKLKDTYRKSYSPHSWTIKMINQKNYHLLQKVIRLDIKDSFNGYIWPVQYDDIMWRRLNR
jgi:hypothetical protein